LDGAAFGAKSLVRRGWKGLDFLGFSRVNLAFSMTYHGFSTNSFSMASAAGASGSGAVRFSTRRLTLSSRRCRFSGSKRGGLRTCTRLVAISRQKVTYRAYPSRHPRPIAAPKACRLAFPTRSRPKVPGFLDRTSSRPSRRLSVHLPKYRAGFGASGDP
jgi:hypothetical protein